MLAIKRAERQETVITVPPSLKPTEIRVEVIRLYGEAVKLGFTAPLAVTIDREEVHLDKRREREEAIARSPRRES